jgi:hypothetical protein
MITPAQPGDLALVKFREMERELLALRVVAGRGLRAQVSPLGTILAADASFFYSHAFEVRLAGTQATVGLGTVNGVEPKIGEVPISGDAKKGGLAPRLDLDAKVAGKGLVSFIAVEAEPDALGQILDTTPLVVVHTATDKINEQDGRIVGRQPLARVRWTAAGTVRDAFQIVHHNLGYARTFPLTGKPRHFFWAL